MPYTPYYMGLSYICVKCPSVPTKSLKYHFCSVFSNISPVCPLNLVAYTAKR